MRAICETCDKPQPIDWHAGDLCVHCSGPVRHELRCFWCNAWGPAAGYCRSCGAEQVDEANYGAARMLTQAGSDMFAIPKLIKEMDPGRLAVFASRYAKQRALVARHVDDLAFVEQFMVQKGFAAAAEDAWVATLPWAQDIPATEAPEDPLERLKVIAETALSPIARELATVARLYVQDWSAFRDVMQMTQGRDAQVSAEAVLAVTWWRTVTVYTQVWTRRYPVEALAQLPFAEHVAVRLAYLGRPYDAAAVATAKLTGNADTKFAAVLADGAVGELATLTSDPDEDVAHAAASVLARRGHTKEIVDYLRRAPTPAQADLLRTLRDKKIEASALREVLLGLMESTSSSDVVVYSGTLLAQRPTEATAVRVAELSRGESYVVQALMHADTGLSTHAMGRVALALAAQNRFKVGMYGVEDAARRGAFPEDLIVRAFDAASQEQRLELCRIAEAQLEGTKSEVTHVALMRIVFGPYDHEVRAAAWWSLSRWYARLPELGYRSKGPMALEPSAIARFFPSVSEFIQRLVEVLGDYATLKEVGYYDFLAHLFGGVDAARAQALAIDGRLTRELVTAMRQAAAWDVWSFLRDALVKSADLIEGRAA